MISSNDNLFKKIHWIKVNVDWATCRFLLLSRCFGFKIKDTSSVFNLFLLYLLYSLQICVIPNMPSLCLIYCCFIHCFLHSCWYIAVAFWYWPVIVKVKSRVLFNYSSKSLNFFILTLIWAGWNFYLTHSSFN